MTEDNDFDWQPSARRRLEMAREEERARAAAAWQRNVRIAVLVAALVLLVVWLMRR